MLLMLCSAERNENHVLKRISVFVAVSVLLQFIFLHCFSCMQWLDYFSQCAISALTPLVGHWEEHLVCKVIE